MIRLSPRLRRLFRFALILLGLAVVAVVAMPLWWPWVFTKVLARFGVTCGSYDRTGYTRLELQDVRYTRDQVQVHADRIGTWQPLCWFSDQAHPRITVDGLAVTLTGASLSSQPDTRPTTDILDQATSTLARALRWVPSGTITNATLMRDTFVLRIPTVAWQDDILRAQIDDLATLEIRSLAAAPYRIHASVEQIEVETILDRTDLGWTISGKTGTVQFEANFGTTGRLPRTARLTGPDMAISTKFLHLYDYNTVHTDLAATWTNQSYSVSLKARANPLPEHQNRRPAMQVSLAAHGNLESITVDTAMIDTAWATAELKAPIETQLQWPMQLPASEWTVTSDLSQLPAASVSGTLHGLATVKPSGTLWPLVDLSLVGTGLSARDQPIQSLNIRSSIAWPLAKLDRLAVVMPDGSTIDASGTANLVDRNIVSARWTLDGAGLCALLPAGVAFESLAASGSVTGPLAELRHTGRFEVNGFTTPLVKPCHITGSWSGTGLAITDLEGLVQASDSAIRFTGAAGFGPSTHDPQRVIIRSGTISKSGQPLLVLQQPMDLAFSVETGVWQMSVDHANWQGPDQSLTCSGHLAWPSSGTLETSVHQVDPSVFADFIEMPGPTFVIEQLDGTVDWDRGPAKVKLDGAIRWAPKQDRSLQATIDLIGNDQGLHLRNLTVTSDDATIAKARGDIPVLLTPTDPQRWYKVLADQPINLQATVSPEDLTWRLITHRWENLALNAPHLEIALEGTTASPRGQVRFQADTIQWTAPVLGIALPQAKSFNVQAAMDRGGITVNSLRFLVADQPVTATASYPLGPDDWRNLLENRLLPGLDKARARVVIDKAPLASFAEYLPSEMRTQGTVNLDLTLKPGMQLDGALTISNGATLPISSIGTVRNINGEIRFDGRTATVKGFHAEIGGEPLVLKGTCALSDQNALSFDFAVTGANIPLVRQPGLIIRSDVDLRLARGASEPARVTGSVQLRDSLFLKDLRLLAPGKQAQATRRPPYFQVTTPGLADCRLDIKIEGDQFLQIRSPVFNGRVSAGFNLNGTLGNPQIVGEATLSEGRISFPFADLDVERGWVSLRQDRPQDPELMVTAQGTAFGYDVSMFVTGSANNPQITFISMPPLPSEEILLMLTTGDLPQGEYTFTTQQRASTLILYLGREMLARLGSDEITADRLTLRTGEEIAEQGNLTYWIEYKINKRLSVVGEYDRFNALNAAFKWKLFGR